MPAPRVDATPPEITCLNPYDGQIVDFVPGTSVTFEERLEDMNSLSKLSVNGATVAVDASDWGTDFVELRATDGAGNATTRTCAFLPSDVWVRDGSRLSNTISVKARQAVFDGSNQTDALDPFADIFATTLNSQRLNTGIDEALSAASPLKPDSCDATLVGSCVLRS